MSQTKLWRLIPTDKLLSQMSSWWVAFYESFSAMFPSYHSFHKVYYYILRYLFAKILKFWEHISQLLHCHHSSLSSYEECFVGGSTWLWHQSFRLKGCNGKEVIEHLVFGLVCQWWANCVVFSLAVSWHSPLGPLCVGTCLRGDSGWWCGTVESFLSKFK